jgi:dTDP-4-dehydrorhamnose reductase
MNNVLVLGNGFLGENIINEFKNNGIQAIGTNYNKNGIYVDITNMDSIISCVEKYSPKIIINCAANVNVDELENNEELAISINAKGAENIAKVCNDNKIRLLHISSDGIFDGKQGMYTEEDVVNPINVYAKSKILGEKLISKNLENYLIIRTNFYGFHNQKKFLFNWALSKLKNNEEIIGFTDVFFNPLEVTNLSKMIYELSEKKICGILNLSSNEVFTKFEFIKKISEVFDFDSKLIKSGSIEELNLNAKRPKNTTLSNEKAKKLLDTKIVTLDTWLHEIQKKIVKKTNKH